MEFLGLVKEKLDKKTIKKLLINFVGIIYVLIITYVVTGYSSNILLPDLFDNERITVDSFLFLSMIFIAAVLFFKEKSIIKFMFVYHFVMIFIVLTVIVPYDLRPLVLLPMLLSLLYDKSAGLAGALSICAYNVFTLAERPDFIVNGPEYMQVIVMLLLTGMSAIIINKKCKVYFEIPLYIVLYFTSVGLQRIFGIYCQDYPGCEGYCETGFKFAYSKGVLLSIGVFLIFRTAYYLIDGKIILKRKIHEITSDTYVLINEMKKKSLPLYNHSVEVAELSFIAAKSIGADKDLAFAGGLFHDIGKLAGANYVHEGVRIANRYKLPLAIKNIIIEHNVKNRLPKTREAAIVMLADTAVSAVEYLRINKKSIDEVSVFENSMITRLKNGALDDSGMTISEFNSVKAVFMQSKALNMK